MVLYNYQSGLLFCSCFVVVLVALFCSEVTVRGAKDVNCFQGLELVLGGGRVVYYVAGVGPSWYLGVAGVLVCIILPGYYQSQNSLLGACMIYRVGS